MAKTVTLNVAVLGLSGPRAEGVSGVGKSTLCARFIHYAHDNFQQVRDDHSSVYSASHFRQAILNSNHFLYHGRVEKRPDGLIVDLHVVEQTEILDADNFGKPFTTTDHAPYSERALAKTLSSPGKLTYGTSSGTRGTGSQPARKQTFFPNPFRVNAYVLVFDPTASELRRQQQRFLLASLAMKLKQQKRLDRALVAVTKCDTVPDSELGRMHKEHQELSRYLQLPVLSVSAVEDINVDNVVKFLTWRVSKRGTTPLVISYLDAMDERRKIALKLLHDWRERLRTSVTIFGAKWALLQYARVNDPAYKRLCEVCGSNEARKVFMERLLEIRLLEASSEVKRHARYSSVGEYSGMVRDHTEAVDRAMIDHGDFTGTERQYYKQVAFSRLSEELNLPCSPPTPPPGYVLFQKTPETAVAECERSPPPVIDRRSSDFRPLPSVPDEPDTNWGSTSVPGSPVIKAPARKGLSLQGECMSVPTRRRAMDPSKTTTLPAKNWRGAFHSPSLTSPAEPRSMPLISSQPLPQLPVEQSFTPSGAGRHVHVDKDYGYNQPLPPLPVEAGLADVGGSDLASASPSYVNVRKRSNSLPSDNPHEELQESLSPPVLGYINLPGRRGGHGRTSTSSLTSEHAQDDLYLAYDPYKRSAGTQTVGDFSHRPPLGYVKFLRNGNDTRQPSLPPKPRSKW